ncbi:MAG: hypothetical protein ACRCUT_03110 [Spirochaetota bacterium]
MEIPCPAHLDGKKEILRLLNKGLSGFFSSIGGQALHMLTEIANIKGAVIPYYEYYYAADSATEAPVAGEMIAPSASKLSSDAGSLLDILEKSETSGEEMLRQMNLAEEIFPVLADILEAAKSISSLQPDISVRELEIIHDRWSDIIYRIETIHRVNFGNSRIKIASYAQESRTIREAVVGRTILSDTEFLQVTGSFAGIEQLLKNVIVSMQSEDIIRQQMEKIIYWIEAVIERTPPFGELLSPFLDKADSSFGDTVLEHRIVMLQETIEPALDQFKDVIASVEAFGEGIRKIADDIPGSESIHSTLDRLAALESSFLSSIDEIVQGKNELLELLHTVIMDTRKIDAVITDLEEKAKAAEEKDAHFEAVWKNIAESIRYIHENHRDANRDAGAAAALYHSLLCDQEESLQHHLFSVRRLSLFITDSRTLHEEGCARISEKIRALSKFAGDGMEDTFSFELVSTAVAYLKGANTAGSAGEYREQIVRRFSGKISEIRSFLSEHKKTGDYPMMMLISLLSEYSENISTDTILF